MFIATRLPSNHSAKSEMLSISLFAEEDREMGAVSINITCLRHVDVPIAQQCFLRQSQLGVCFPAERTRPGRRFGHHSPDVMLLHLMLSRRFD